MRRTNQRLCACGARIVPGPGERNPRKWCSDACRVAISRGLGQRRCLIGKPCPICGSAIGRPAATCSRLCYEELERRRARERYQRGKALKPAKAMAVPCRDCGTSVALAPTDHGLLPRYCTSCRAERQREWDRRKSVRRRGATATRTFTIAEVGDRDAWTCHLCGAPVERGLSGMHPEGPTIDHLIPLSLGGLDLLHNVALAHRTCNTRRGVKSLEVV